MKLYIVIYLTGAIIGSVGPLPYDEKECQRRTVSELSTISDALSGDAMMGLRMECEWHAVRPPNDPSAAVTLQ